MRFLLLLFSILISAAATAAEPLCGLWEYPADETILEIRPTPDQKGHFDVVVHESVDCRLERGMKIGMLTASADPDKYRLRLYSQIKNGIPTLPKDCLATLTDKGTVLHIESPKLKLTVTPSIILPTLWSTLRLNVRLRHTNPVDRLPQGWLRLNSRTSLIL